MDADKRHYLKQNELAEALTKLRNLSSHREVLYWLVAVAVVLLAVVGYRGWGSLQASLAAKSWHEFSQVSQKVQSKTVGALDEMRGIISNASNPTLAASARIQLAAALRESATQTGTIDQAALQESIEVLKPLLNEPGLSPTLAGAAALSLASSYETLRQFDEAEHVYNIILSNQQRFAGTNYVNVAAERLETLPELRKPVEFAAGLPPPPTGMPTVTVQQPGSTSPMQLDVTPVGPSVPPAEAPESGTPDVGAQPAPAEEPASGEPAPAEESAASDEAPAPVQQPAGNAAGGEAGAQTPVPATQPVGNQGP